MAQLCYKTLSFYWTAQPREGTIYCGNCRGANERDIWMLVSRRSDPGAQIYVGIIKFSVEIWIFKSLLSNNLTLKARETVFT